MLTVLFPCEPFNIKAADSIWLKEYEAAKSLGFQCFLIDYEALEVEGNTKAAIRAVTPSETIQTAVYRGWMLKSESYSKLSNALNQKGVNLLNTPDQYQMAHHLPLSYPYVKEFTAQTAWIETDDIKNREKLKVVLEPFGENSLVIKDWVKSQASGYWLAACFIPNASDIDRVDMVIDRFVQLQDNSLTGGIVFRKFEELSTIQDLAEEWRVFTFKGQVMCVGARNLGMNTHEMPSMRLIEQICQALPSNFATLDFAKKKDGGWLLLEVGDGGVSELPWSITPNHFWQQILEKTRENEADVLLKI